MAASFIDLSKTVCFVHPHRNNLNVGSYRLQTLCPVNYLRKNLKKWKFEIVSNVKEAESFNPDAIVCMQINDIGEALELRSRTCVKVIGFQSDGPIGTTEHLRALDGVVVDSAPLLWRLPRGMAYINHIYTPLEIDPEMFRPHTHPGHKLRMVYIGAKGNLFFAEEMISRLKQDGYDVSILSDHPNADIAWNVDTYANELDKFDVGIVPYPENLQINQPNQFPGFFYKDPSRPTLLQAIGLPVVVSPLPSYILYEEQFGSGLVFANTLEEWKDRLDLLQSDPQVYNLKAKSGYNTSWKVCTEALGEWAWLLGDLLCA